MSTGIFTRVRRWWVAGILVLAPTALTAWVVWTLFRFFDDILGGELRQRGISVLGLGFVLLNLLLLLLGFVATNFLGRRAFALYDRLMHRVPLINKIYSTLRQIAEVLLGSPESAAFRRVALVEYPATGTHMVGFVTSTAVSEAGEKLGRKVCYVFVPSAVNPTTGFLLVVPEEKVRYLDMTPEQAMRMIVSAGTVVPPG
ncbi:MAG: DUF502 domain-containing protein [Thermoanaerobaculia bacterium]